MLGARWRRSQPPRATEVSGFGGGYVARQRPGVQLETWGSGGCLLHRARRVRDLEWAGAGRARYTRAAALRGREERWKPEGPPARRWGLPLGEAS